MTLFDFSYEIDPETSLRATADLPEGRIQITHLSAAERNERDPFEYFQRQRQDLPDEPWTVSMVLPAYAYAIEANGAVLHEAISRLLAKRADNLARQYMQTIDVAL